MKPRAPYMTDKQIEDKHRALRGSDALKYVRGTDQSVCDARCGGNDSAITGISKEFYGYESHPCFLRAGHEGAHEFSSECRV